MNFLGHLFLSGDRPLVIVGNFMGDGVKGRDLSRFDPELEAGIRLHRAIDHFTDQHSATREAKALIRPYAGRYSGVVADIFYDHFLAAQWHDLHDEPLDRFVERIYGLLGSYRNRMPDRIERMVPYMVEGDWLGNYARVEGVARALMGLSRRAMNGHVMQGAEAALLEHYEILNAGFHRFLPDIQEAMAKGRWHG